MSPPRAQVKISQCDHGHAKLRANSIARRIKRRSSTGRPSSEIATAPALSHGTDGRQLLTLAPLVMRNGKTLTTACRLAVPRRSGNRGAVRSRGRFGIGQMDVNPPARRARGAGPMVSACSNVPFGSAKMHVHVDDPAPPPGPLRRTPPRPRAVTSGTHASDKPVLDPHVGHRVRIGDRGSITRPFLMSRAAKSLSDRTFQHGHATEIPFSSLIQNCRPL